MQTRIPDIKPGIEVLKYYQIAGGLIGIGLSAPYLINSEPMPGLTLFIVFCVIALYFFSIYCGLLLFWKIKRGLAYSRVNQMLQLVSVSMLGYTFHYISGLYLFLGIDLTESFVLRLNVGLSSWQVNIHSDNTDFVININLVAIL